MDNKEIVNCYKRNDTKRKLNASEMQQLYDKIQYQFNGSKEFVDYINARMHYVLSTYVENVYIYSCFIPVFIDNIWKCFMKSVIEPGTPIGAYATEAISQQSMQGVMNTSHQTGTSKPSGAQGIKENIGISEKREVVYTIIHFLNNYYTFTDVLNLKKKFINLSVKDLCKDMYTVYTNIEDHLNSDIPKSKEEAIDMYKKGINWWYKYGHHEEIDYSQKRICLRLVLDVDRLYEFNVSTSEVANKISSIHYSISKGKKKTDKNKYYYVCLPSPTFIGVIDCYISSENNPEETDYTKDYFIQKSLADNDFKHINISGIEGISNYYPITKNVTGCIQSIEPCYEYRINENGKLQEYPKGTWVYFKDKRFNHIPVNRFISLCEDCGLKCYETDESSQFANLDFNSHKIRLENRKVLQIRVYVLDEDDIGRKTLDGKKITNIKENLYEEIGERTYKDGEYFYFVTKSKGNIKSKDVKVKNVEEVDEYLAKLNNPEDKFKTHYEFFGKEEVKHKAICLYYNIKQDGEKIKIKSYINCVLLKEMSVKIKTNLKEINNVNNYITLDNCIISSFCIKNIIIPNKYRLPKVKVLEFVSNFDQEKIRKAVFVDTFLPFRKTNDDNSKPLDKFTSFLEKFGSKNLKEYVYAECSGSCLSGVVSSNLVDKSKSYSNVYSQVNKIYGIEGVRNLIAFDLKGVIDISGYINAKYTILIADVITSNGINAFTSSGISNQKTGAISVMTFDNVELNLVKYSQIGKKYSIKSVSTCIMTGNEIPVGTGYAKIAVSDSEILHSVQKENDTFEFRNNKRENTDNYDSNFEFDNMLYVKKGKFPLNHNMVSKYIKKTISYYFNNIVDKMRDNSLTYLKPIILPKKGQCKFKIYINPIL